MTSYCYRNCRHRGLPWQIRDLVRLALIILLIVMYGFFMVFAMANYLPTSILLLPELPGGLR